MIPIGLPSYEFVLIRLAYLAATLIWLFWVLRLAFAKNARGRLWSWRGPVFLLLTAIAFYSIWSVYAFRRDLGAYAAEYVANFQPVLEQPQRWGGIEMPAGTRLHLAVALERASFNRAEFPHPVPLGGVEALRAERYLTIHTDQNYQTAGFTPLNLRLTGLGTSEQDGWLCDAGGEIAFETHPDGTIKAFQNCIAAAGNLIEGAKLPMGAEIIASEGRLFLDGRRGADRWLIHLPQEADFMHQGETQRGGALMLDGDRKVIERIAP